MSTEDSSPRDRLFIEVHAGSGRDGGPAVELRPSDHECPHPDDITGLTDEGARELFYALAEYFEGQGERVDYSGAVFDAIARNASPDNSGGAAVADVIETVLDDTDAGVRGVCATIQRLLGTGELYVSNPHTGAVKPTDSESEARESSGTDSEVDA